MKQLEFELPIGYNVNGNYTRQIKLLRSNAIAEEVFTSKIPEKPYTWIAHVIAVATEKIGDVEVGWDVRENYLKTKSVSIPQVVLDMPLADANSMLLEVHRRVWQNLMPNQKIVCKFCAKSLTADIDLDKVTMPEDQMEILNSSPEGFNAIDCKLEYGIDLSRWISKSKKEEFEAYKGVEFNKLTFKIPTLRDAIKNEQYASKSLELWRRIGIDCLAELEAVNEEGEVTHKFPSDKFIWLGLEMYNYADAKDLRTIRKHLREELPTMPFAYTEECPCDLKRDIPFAMEASGFFSE